MSVTPVLDMNSVRQEVEKELNDERVSEAKKKLKSKLKELQAAKKLVTNIERELSELEHELSVGL